MAHLLTVYIHLVATCMAIGIIVLTDMRLLAQLAARRAAIAPPERLETLVIIGAMATLVLSGLALVLFGLAANPNYLHNPKLQAKILLVGLLVVNAFTLHYVTFPRLAKARPIASWTTRDHLCVVLPAALSNSLWMYCAFLGIARSWNFTVPVSDVLTVALVLFATCAVAIRLALHVGARNAAQQQPDRIGSMGTRTIGRVPLMHDVRNGTPPLR